MATMMMILMMRIDDDVDDDDDDDDDGGDGDAVDQLSPKALAVAEQMIFCSHLQSFPNQPPEKFNSAFLLETL